jgi:cysteine-rich repeat protein
VCGNGVVQPGEACDDGNGVNDDCCHDDCTAASPGTDCAPPVPFPGVCDASGNCAAIPTLSEWGVILLSLLMLAAVLRYRRGARSSTRADASRMRGRFGRHDTANAP